ncbi:Cytosolic sulfotransferase 15 [Acorus calamus]|uniref:Sulfotransferase n=1 Tax=Acorus calamus TaxID=4465 RepID=A0AAV9D6A5_ACOCL|nr:Cytosolic sulfotransferase 15 [Acorus calamus]
MITNKKYMEIIPTLPKNQGWGNGKTLYQYQGSWHLDKAIEGTIAVQDRFVPCPTDIVLATVPKSGTTWLKALAFAIFNRANTDPNFIKSTFTKTNPQACIPFLEIQLFSNHRITDINIDINRLPPPRLLATHIPFSSFPQSNCKLIYLCRDPKDSFVSAWHFFNGLGAKDGHKPVALEDVFELFCSGVSPGGPIWDHALGYWRESLRRPERVLFLKYEELKENTEKQVRRIASFMGCPFGLEEEEGGVVEEIVKVCSFNSLSCLEVNRSGTTEVAGFDIENRTFLRRGEVGDWKNYLSVEMAERIDRVTEEKLRGSGLSF